MKAYDYEAATYDGAVYCVECLPEGAADEAHPIFASDEWSAPGATCDQCGTVHDYMSLTPAPDDGPDADGWTLYAEHQASVDGYAVAYKGAIFGVGDTLEAARQDAAQYTDAPPAEVPAATRDNESGWQFFRITARLRAAVEGGTPANYRFTDATMTTADTRKATR